MKKILFLMCTALAIIGCSKNQDNNVILTKYDNPNDPFNIGDSISNLTSIKDQSDTTKTYVVGILDNKIWIGYYDTKSKSKLSEFKFSNTLPKTITINLGYGEYKTYSVIEYRPASIKWIHGDIVFLLYSIYDGPYYGIASLCKIHERTMLVKEGNTKEFIGRISEWADDTYLAESSINKYYILDKNFNTLLESAKFIDSSCPRTYISMRDFIFYKEGKLYRTNIEEKNDRWATPITESNARISNAQFTISDNIVTFSCDYTLYSGQKGTLTKYLNIETGMILEPDTPD